MKKYVFALLVLLAASCCVVPLAATRPPSLRVTVDPRIELLAVVQLLSGYRFLTRYDVSYKRDVIEYFSPHKNHPAVRLFAENERRRFQLRRSR